MWACRPTVFAGSAAGIAGLLGRLLAARTAPPEPPGLRTTAAPVVAACGHAALQCSTGVRQNRGPARAAASRPYGPCSTIMRQNILLPFYLFPHTKKSDLQNASRIFFVLALPIFPCSHPQSIVGEGELNFCVRDGNRWTLTPINTNFVEAFLPRSGCTLKTEHELFCNSSRL